MQPAHKEPAYADDESPSREPERVNRRMASRLSAPYQRRGHARRLADGQTEPDDVPLAFLPVGDADPARAAGARATIRAHQYQIHSQGTLPGLQGVCLDDTIAGAPDCPGGKHQLRHALPATVPGKSATRPGEGLRQDRGCRGLERGAAVSGRPPARSYAGPARLNRYPGR